jgi:hypothetical protein
MTGTLPLKIDYWHYLIPRGTGGRMASGNNYHSQAVEKVRTFIRLLGSSLSKKNSNTLPESARTYSMFAKQEFCEGEPLIPKPEEDQIPAASEDAPIVGCWTRCRAYTSTLGCAIFLRLVRRR